MSEIKEILLVLKERPLMTMIIMLLLGGGGGMSLGAFANRPADLSARVDILEHDKETMQKTLDRMENKLDRLIERRHGQ